MPCVMTKIFRMGSAPKGARWTSRNGLRDECREHSRAEMPGCCCLPSDLSRYRGESLKDTLTELTEISAERRPIRNPSIKTRLKSMLRIAVCMDCKDSLPLMNDKTKEISNERRKIATQAGACGRKKQHI